MSEATCQSIFCKESFHHLKSVLVQHCYFLFLEKKKGKRNGSLRTKNPDSYRDQGKPDASGLPIAIGIAWPAPPPV
jgi:hypothetical protein